MKKENVTQEKIAQKKGRQEKDFLQGSLWDNILLFSIPIIITNILQQLFNTADIAVVGQLVGNDALAAVGCTSPVVTLFISLFSGLAVGANAIIARYLGAKDTTKTREAVHASLAVAAVAGIGVMIVGEIITKPLLELVSTPADVMDLAIRYLRIYFLGSIFLMFYNFEAAILRSGGDTKKPVLVLMISGIINIVLNLFFVVVCHMSVDGVALATLISNILSAGILFVVLMKKEDDLQLTPQNIRFYHGMTKVVLMTGIPAALQGMLFNIANIVIQSGVNSLGAVVVAGSTVGLNVEIFAYYIVNGFGQASITFNSQNFGAGNLKRCEQSTRWCIGLGFLAAVITTLFMIVFRQPLARLFTKDEAVVHIAAVRIIMIAGFEVFNMIIEVMSGALRGLGYSVLPMILSIFFVCGVRIFWLFLIFPLNKTFEWLFAVYPISWGLAAFSLVIAYFLIKRKLWNQTYL